MVKPISFAEENKSFKIKDIIARGKSKNKLMEQGFCIGEDLCVLKGDGSTLIVKLKENKYILNLSLANKIIVEG